MRPMGLSSRSFPRSCPAMLRVKSQRWSIAWEHSDRSWEVGWSGFCKGYTGNSKAGYLLMSGSLMIAGCSMLLLRPVSQQSNTISIGDGPAIQHQ